jgi:hypothetical protein
MLNQHLATYLSDHLAGSVATLELLEHLEKLHAGTATEGFVAALRAEISADQKELQALMARLHISPSLPRKATAWLAAKISEIKLRVDEPAGTALRRLKALEAISIGIEGKRLLCVSLDTVAEDVPELRMDYERLQKRAQEQRQQVEAHRLEAAVAALVPASENRG